jgi:GTP cyclohydrolase I
MGNRNKDQEENEDFNSGIERYERRENYNNRTMKAVAKSYARIIELLEEDPTRQGVLNTPTRAAKAMQFLTHGYDMDPSRLLKSAMFEEDHKHMVIVKDIEIYSMCEHHMLPFFGKAHIAYIPNGWIVGLSKIPRVADAFARRLQVQERLTDQIKDCIQNTLNPLGVAVVIEAQHMCMQIRGVQKQNSVTTTSSFTGEFEKDPTRKEFISLISTNLH